MGRPSAVSLTTLAVMLCSVARAEAQSAGRPYQEECEGGDMSACLVLGGMLESGDGVRQDLDRAATLYARACDGGELEACTNLGLMYEAGRGVPVDSARARERYRTACEGGDPLACGRLEALTSSSGARPEDVLRRVWIVRDAETGRGLSEAVVELPDLGVRAVTNQNGRLELAGVRPGRHEIQVDRFGYERLRETVDVPADGELAIPLNRAELEDEEAPGRIRGRVTDESGRPLQSVAVSLVGREGTQTLTAGDGSFGLEDVDPGFMEVRLSRLGYAPRSFDLVVHPGGTAAVLATMSTQAIELAPIEVTTTARSGYLERNGFYRRAQYGFGTQFDAEELELEAPTQPADVLWRTPGVLMANPRAMPGAPNQAASRRGQCILTVYVDGLRQGTNINQIPLESLGGMEIYVAGDTPPEYRGTNPCGVVLLWTRR